MTREIWLNLPVKEVEKTAAFFTAIGFHINQHAPNDEKMVSIKFGQKDFIVNFFRKDVYNSFTPYQAPDVTESAPCLISIDAESKTEVDELLQKAKNAGANVYAHGGEKDGWMYGGGFSDLDGHKWNILYMDFSKFPNQ